MDLSIQDEKRDFSLYDANELFTIVCNKENLLEKKRRWLQLPAYISSGSKLVQRKRPKFLAERFVPESYVRKDEISCDIVRNTVEESFRFLCNNQAQHHEVANSFDPANAHAMEGKERILSITRDLTNTALYSIACIVTRNNLKFKRTRSELIEVVKDHLTSYLSDAGREPDEYCRLSKVFKNPNSYLPSNLHIVTPVTKHLRVSISKTLEQLDELTIIELDAVFRRLSGAKVKPCFPPVVKNHCSTETLLLKVKRLCHEYYSSLQEGQEMPKEFANGLTVVILSLCRLGHTTIPISEFCPFPKEVLSTQMEILHALRSLPKLRKEEIGTLIPLIDPTGMVPRNSFRNTLKKYMIEYLFVCDEIIVPKEVLRAVDVINKRPQTEPHLFSEENRDKEVEAVLNVSCYLNSVAADLLLEKVSEGSVNVEIASEVYDEGKNNWCSEHNDFKFCGTDYFFNSVREGLGNDLEETYSNAISESVNSTKGPSFSTDSFKIPRKPSEKQDGGSQACSSKAGNKIRINEICDEAAIVAHKLIGHVIDGFLKLEKTEADELTLSYLTYGLPNTQNHGLPNTQNHRGAKAKSNVEETNIIFDAVEKILPSFPKSSLVKVKSLMEL